MSYKGGVMTCRSNVRGVTLEEKLSMLSTESIKKIDVVNNTNNLDETTKGFLKGVKTTCRSMGHTVEAAKFAR
jgi:ribosomal protein L11